MPLSLRVKLPSGKTERVSLSEEDPSSSLVAILLSSFPQELSSSGVKENDNAEKVQLLRGFPPKKISPEELSLPVGQLFRPNEPIIVQKQGGINPSSSSSPSNGKKPPTSKKRKAVGDKSTSKVGDKASKNPKTTFGAKVYSLHKPVSSSSKSSKSKTSTTMKSRPVGFSSMQSGISKRQKAQKTPRRSRMELSSEDDIGTHLLSAVSAGSSGKKNRFLRATFRRAVELEYEATKAQARVMSLLSGKYSIQESQTARTLGSSSQDSEATQIIVQFHKGHGNRSYHFETVDLISKAQLKAVIMIIMSNDETTRGNQSTSSLDGSIGTEQGTNGGEGREMLRARYLSQCSPRVFWSLVYYFGPSIPAALQALLPNVDWSWMVGEEEADGTSKRARGGLGGGLDGDSTRRRTLSEKALENRRQELEAAEEKKEKEQLKKIMAEKEQARAVNNNNKSNASTTKISEEDISSSGTVTTPPKYHGPEEEAEGMLRYLLQTSREDAGHTSSSVLRAWQSIFVLHSGAELSFPHLLHYLAEVSVPPDLSLEGGEQEDVEEYLSLLQCIQREVDKSFNNDDDSSSLHSDNAFPSAFLTLSHLRFWICSARWMLWTFFWRREVFSVGNGVLSSESLQRVGIKSVSDLAMWRHSPTGLADCLDDSGLPHPTEIDLLRICQVAHQFREQNQWVDSFAMEISGDDSAGGEMWYKSLPPSCLRLLPEAELRELQCGNDDDGAEEWRTLLDCGLYEGAVGLREHMTSGESSKAPTREPSDHLGARVRYAFDASSSIVPVSSRSAEESNGEESGLVVGYLPPSSDEPMALWKVLLQSGEWQDLEEHELAAGLAG